MTESPRIFSHVPRSANRVKPHQRERGNQMQTPQSPHRPDEVVTVGGLTFQADRVRVVTPRPTPSETPTAPCRGRVVSLKQRLIVCPTCASDCPDAGKRMVKRG